MTQLGSVEHFQKIYNKMEAQDRINVEYFESENLIAELKKANARLTDEIDNLKTESERDKRYIGYVENKYYELEKEIIELKKTD